VRDEEAFRRAFNSLRTEDARRAPSFDAIVHHRLHRARSLRSLRLGLTVSALTLVLLIVALGVAHRRTTSTHPGGSAFILAWRAPTDFLLDTPGSQLMRDIPEIGNGRVPEPGPSAMPSSPAAPQNSEPERHL
jgi:hypothetical protein